MTITAMNEESISLPPGLPRHRPTLGQSSLREQHSSASLRASCAWPITRRARDRLLRTLWSSGSGGDVIAPLKAAAYQHANPGLYAMGSLTHIQHRVESKLAANLLTIASHTSQCAYQLCALQLHTQQAKARSPATNDCE